MSSQSSLQSELQKIILPVISKDREDSTIQCHGTGFLIVACGRRAYMVTAAHVIEAIRRIESPNLPHHPTTPVFFRPVHHLFNLRRVIPAVLFYDSRGSGHEATIHACVDMPKADLALCRIEFPDAVACEVQFKTRLVVDTTPIKQDDLVRAFGYSNMKVRKGIADESPDNLATFDARLIDEPATVSAVYPTRGPTNQEHPCFQISVPIRPGMSGGPVMTIGEDGVPCVRGVVRSDETRVAEPASAQSPPTAIASMLWPAMLMPLTGPDHDGTVSGRKLIELEQQGLIIDRGRASEHIKFTQADNGQVIEAHWET